ncbi:DsbA family protein [Streptomyces sp. NPDC090022]|uniref:DsbA family protein n=1 Tax=Streptomyces sp. NPDC090022 TaxID=3365920 RepID=UPI00381697CF
MRAIRTARALVAVAVLGLTATACGDRTAAGERARRDPYASIADLPETLAPDGTTIIVGDPRRKPVRLYEDPRSPGSREAEATGAGAALLDMTLGKEIRTEYTLVSATDGGAGGAGSQKAANALRAALEQERFAEYRAVLLRNQPAASTDGFTDAFLLELASQVDGLRGPAFDSAVREMRYADFVAASQRAYEDAGAPALPAAAVDGVLLSPAQSELLLTPDIFRLVVSGRL